MQNQRGRAPLLWFVAPHDCHLSRLKSTLPVLDATVIVLVLASVLASVVASVVVRVVVRVVVGVLARVLASARNRSCRFG